MEGWLNAAREPAPRQLGELADAAALRSYSASLRGLLLQRPARGFAILGLDPGMSPSCCCYCKGGMLLRLTPAS